MARDNVKGRCHFDSGCYPNSSRDVICIGCRYSLYAWIDELEKISNRSTLHSALYTYQGYSKQYLCGQCKNHCVFIQAVVEILKKGIDSIPPLTHFLRPTTTRDSDAWSYTLRIFLYVYCDDHFTYILCQNLRCDDESISSFLSSSVGPVTCRIQNTTPSDDLAFIWVTS